MALTADLKYELIKLRPSKGELRLAELSVILRFTASVHVINATMVLEAEFESSQLAGRVKSEIKELFGIESRVDILHASGVRKSSRHNLRVVKQADLLVRQTGLYYPTGKPVRGIHSRFVSDSVDVAASVWRGALLAQGSLTDPGRTASLEISCPSNEAASSLVGLAKRLGVAGAKSREVRGVHRVVIREGDDISKLLELVGAAGIQSRWDQLRAKREVRTTANRLANFDDANLRRSAQAAVAAGARVARALEILGPDIPAHLKHAGELRLNHKQASLDELGHLATPPMTKDAVAGRIRRLLAMADKKAEELGIPNTEAYLGDDSAE
ncbi:MAG: DNA-binding protein WhiA [Rhodoluna sp.]|jgi:DNA-binding protein WhiA|nr:DNA-binding protein WhiA [Rhodoluna sp.]